MNTVLLFWSNYPDNKANGLAAWRQQPLVMSELHKLSIASYAKFADKALIYTYQQPPACKYSNVQFADAADIFPAEEAFAALAQGHSLAHISDVVRLDAAIQHRGIVLDMDAVLLREPPVLPFFFASMPAKLTGGFAPKWGKAHPPLAVHDKSWDGKALSAFPVKVSEDIAIEIRALITRIKTTLRLLPLKDSKAWNYIMWDLKRIGWIKKEAVVLPPLAFCPIPAWIGAGKCYSLQAPSKFDGEQQLFGYTFPSVEQILTESYAVQHFFESSYKAAAKVGSDFWTTLPAGCLLAHEARHVFGETWRAELAAI